ncbi:MAG: SDR family oxidoreductase [Planctomycetales bacterium]|nr:SDR family oxidoreductase [Planctomycetales bacterium]
MSILDRFRLDGKRLLITGASRGLGRSMALAMADAGADVVLVSRDAERLEQTASEIRALGRDATAIAADLSAPTTCEELARRALDEFNRIDILVNNVGGRTENIPLAEQTLEQWRRLMDLNLTSAFVLMREIGGAMVRQAQGGRIINIASINSFVVGRNIGGRHYETAKAAMMQLTRAAAVDWAPHGITVNAICPGPFMTDANLRWKREYPDMIEGILKLIPVGAYGEPDDLGPLAVYLASDASRFMTGAALVIDGGYTLS